MFLPMKYYCYPHLTDGKIRSYNVTLLRFPQSSSRTGPGIWVSQLWLMLCSERDSLSLYHTCSGDSPLDIESLPCDLLSR